MDDFSDEEQGLGEPSLKTMVVIIGDVFCMFAHGHFPAFQPTVGTPAKEPDNSPYRE